MNQTGRKSESLVLAHLVNQGYDVALPVLSPFCATDVLFRMDDYWQAVQVKSAYREGKSLIVDMRRSDFERSRYERKDVDWLAVVGSCWLWMIPFDFVYKYKKLRMGAIWDNWKIKI